MKIIAFYLPQFHNIPENDLWWGEGFTEWTNVRNAVPIYPGHKQPKTPLNDNYYDLLDDDVKIWQAETAKKFGIYGFCYYHYWFNGKLLLEKPMEQMLKNDKIDIPFCICWANEAWTKSWVSKETTVLIPQTYGDLSEWSEHFFYLLPFFKDPRYIKIDDCPVIIIYRPAVIDRLKEMLDHWSMLAKESGFPGLRTMCVTQTSHINDSDTYDLFDNIIEWQPQAAKTDKNNTSVIAGIKKLRRKIFNSLETHTGINLYNHDILTKLHDKKKQFIDYDTVWKNIINMSPLSKKSIPGAFVRWDNTPRFHERGMVIKNESPDKFFRYMTEQIDHAKKAYSSDMIFLYAWNEWAEGGYMEPDTENGYEYLEALRRSLEETDELP